MGKGRRDSRLTRALAGGDRHDRLLELTPLGALLRAWESKEGRSLVDEDPDADRTAYAYAGEGVDGVVRSNPTTLVAFHAATAQLAIADIEKVHLAIDVDEAAYRQVRAAVIRPRSDDVPLDVPSLFASVGVRPAMNFRRGLTVVSDEDAADMAAPDTVEIAPAIEAPVVEETTPAVAAAAAPAPAPAPAVTLTPIPSAGKAAGLTPAEVADITAAWEANAKLPKKKQKGQDAQVKYVPAITGVKLPPGVTWTPTDALHFKPGAFKNNYLSEIAERTKVQYDRVPPGALHPQVRFWTFEPYDVPQRRLDLHRRLGLLDGGAVQGWKKLGLKEGRPLTLEDIPTVIDDFHGEIIARIEAARAEDPATLPPGTVIMTGEVATTGFINSYNVALRVRGLPVYEHFLRSLERVHAAAKRLSAERKVTIFLGTVRPAEAPEVVTYKTYWKGEGQDNVVRRLYNTFFIYRNGELSIQDKFALYPGTETERAGGVNRKGEEVPSTLSDFESTAPGAFKLYTEPFEDGIAVFMNCHEYKVITMGEAENKKIHDELRALARRRGGDWRIAEIDRAEEACRRMYAQFQDPSFVRRVRAIYHNSNWSSSFLSYFREFSGIGEHFRKLVPEHPGFWVYITNMCSGSRSSRINGIYRVQPPHDFIGYTPLVDNAPPDEIILTKTGPLRGGAWGGSGAVPIVTTAAASSAAETAPTSAAPAEAAAPTAAPVAPKPTPAPAPASAASAPAAVAAAAASVANPAPAPAKPRATAPKKAARDEGSAGAAESKFRRIDLSEILAIPDGTDEIVDNKGVTRRLWEERDKRGTLKYAREGSFKSETDELPVPGVKGLPKADASALYRLLDRILRFDYAAARTFDGLANAMIQFDNNSWIPKVVTDERDRVVKQASGADLRVDDWALRILIPTLQTQVRQYKEGSTTGEYDTTFVTYKQCVRLLTEAGWERVSRFGPGQYFKIVEQLGAQSVRWEKLQSVRRWVDEWVARDGGRYDRTRPPAALLALSAEEFIRDAVRMNGVKVKLASLMYQYLHARDEEVGYAARTSREAVFTADTTMAELVAPGVFGAKAGRSGGYDEDEAITLFTAAAKDLSREQKRSLYETFRGLVEGGRFSAEPRADVVARRVVENWGRKLEVDPDYLENWWAHMVVIYHKRALCDDIAKYGTDAMAEQGTTCNACPKFCGAQSAHERRRGIEPTPRAVAFDQGDEALTSAAEGLTEVAAAATSMLRAVAGAAAEAVRTSQAEPAPERAPAQVTAPAAERSTPIATAAAVSSAPVVEAIPFEDEIPLHTPEPVEAAPVAGSAPAAASITVAAAPIVAPVALGVSVRDSGADALAEARMGGVRVIQIYADPGTYSYPKDKTPIASRADLLALRSALAQDPHTVFMHAPNAANLASEKGFLRQGARELLARSLEAGELLGARGVVIHCGKPQGRSREDAIEDAAKAARVWRPGMPPILFENAAGAGSEIGTTAEDLDAILTAAVRAGLPQNAVGVVLDTQHAHAAHPDGVLALAHEMRMNGMIYFVRLVHANDSEPAAGGRRDKHASIGDGTIPADAWRQLLEVPELAAVPWVLETPDDGKGRRQDLERLAQRLAS